MKSTAVGKSATCNISDDLLKVFLQQGMGGKKECFGSLNFDTQNLKPICHFPCREVSYVKHRVLGDAIPCRLFNMIPTFRRNQMPPSASFFGRFDPLGNAGKIFTNLDGVTSQKTRFRQHRSENIGQRTAIFELRTDILLSSLEITP